MEGQEITDLGWRRREAWEASNWQRAGVNPAKMRKECFPRLLPLEILTFSVLEIGTYPPEYLAGACARLGARLSPRGWAPTAAITHAP